MTRKDLIQKVQQDQGLSKAAAEKAVKSVFDALASALQTEDRVPIPGLGVFKAKTKEAHEVYSALTGKTHSVPERRVVTFKAAKVS